MRSLLASLPCLRATRRILEQAAAMGSVFWLGGLVALGRLDQKAPEYWRSMRSRMS